MTIPTATLASLLLDAAFGWGTHYYVPGHGRDQGLGISAHKASGVAASLTPVNNR